MENTSDSSQETYIPPDDEDGSEEFSSFDVKCEHGYTLDNNENCVDIDECTHLIAPCENYQYCHNTIGSYRCLNIQIKSCEEGYNFNTKTGKCVGKLFST